MIHGNCGKKRPEHSKRMSGRNNPKWRPLEDRFMDKIAFIPFHSCWEWVGGTSRGWGIIRFNDKIPLAHRVSFELFKGKRTKGKHIHHACFNKLCVNPDHLVEVTSSEHTRIHNLRN